jgi:hypothetical protein
MIMDIDFGIKNLEFKDMEVALDITIAAYHDRAARMDPVTGE